MKTILQHIRETVTLPHTFMRGRTDSHICRSHARVAPLVMVDGGDEPKLTGLPYWKTCFSRRGFSKTLYTPSSLRLLVGRDYMPDPAQPLSEWLASSERSPLNRD